MPTVSRTWTFTSDAEGLADVGDSAIVATWDSAGAALALEFICASGQTNLSERARGPVTSGKDWTVLFPGLPGGATVTDIQCTGADHQEFANAGNTNWRCRIRVVDSAGVSVHSAGDLLDFTRASPGTGAVKTAMGAGTSRAVDSGKQAASTIVALEVQFSFAGTTTGAGIDDDFDNIAITITYSTVSASATIATPTASQNVTTNPFLVTASVTGTPHHIQFEISADAGATWQRLSAKNRQANWETNFNTWRFPNGSYQVRVKTYSGAAESSLVNTSAAITFTITIAAGTVRDYVGGTNTPSAAITAASAGDTIRLSGVFTDEGSSVNINKRVKIIQNPGLARAVIRSRIRITADGVYCSEVDFITGGQAASPEPEAKGAVIRGEPTNPISITNTGSGIGLQEASTIPFDADGSFDTLLENVNIYDCGSRSTETNSAHGIYVQNSLRLFVRECIFWHNAARQIQLYPQAIEATIYKCALYDSEMGVLFGGDTSTGAGMGDANGARVFKTNYSTVEDCIIGKGGGDDGSSTDGLVYTFWGNSVGAGTGNEILDTYLHTPPTAGGGSGKYIDTALGGLTSVSGNVTTTVLPGYVLPSVDFDLVPNAPALGYGPDRIQPSGSIPTQTFDLSGIFPKPRMRKVRV